MAKHRMQTFIGTTKGMFLQVGYVVNSLLILAFSFATVVRQAKMRFATCNTDVFVHMKYNK